MEISHLLLPSPLLSGDVEGLASSPSLYGDLCDAFVINGWQLAGSSPDHTIEIFKYTPPSFTVI